MAWAKSLVKQTIANEQRCNGIADEDFAELFYLLAGKGGAGGQGERHHDDDGGEATDPDRAHVAFNRFVNVGENHLIHGPTDIIHQMVLVFRVHFTLGGQLFNRVRQLRDLRFQLANACF